MPAESTAPGIRFKTPLFLLLCAALASCGGIDALPPRKIALLAPFEGQYREIGYNALFALRLAFADAEPQNLQLLAVDDGGTLSAALARIKALNRDPAVGAIIALGPAATDPAIQAANDKAMILIGNWGQDRADEHSLYAANPDLTRARGSGDLLALAQTSDLWTDLESISFESSGSLPDAEFVSRYVNSAPHAPTPNLLATLTYDIGRLALAALTKGESLNTTSHQGITGVIRFQDGYWVDAPVKRYRYEGDQLALAAD